MQKNKHFSVSDLLGSIDGIKSRPQVMEKYVNDQIRYRIERLRAKFNMCQMDIDDVRQNFMLALVVGMPKYQAKKGTWRTFITAIFDNCYRYQLRKLALDERNETRNAESVEELDEDHDLTPAYFEDKEMIVDVDSAIAQMTPQCKKVISILEKHSPAQTARILHVSKSTVSRIIKKIREHFLAVGIKPQMYGCNVFAPAVNKYI